ncbi:MAG: phosphoglycerate mutase (2,3-diphosphoglycerate-independent) [Candidatus Sungbacteria bacterium RIFCSPLOWO2_12_FULL_41_11]|uniref:2,3-bisphosphoglycerate-independent phosphoglycerate mutase n=1 Tax=Candidatus Sungbacteria bacterium RIFCSPLOWO2_12_FULL_41_11 TaxID=1802286 RepID=A0A1G2LSJ8_9BACT|nr:MAG: 2,3-bisphosphoglycerate-independent phosphoglycerate mutase [Parcubacteria group bacterium GW2011_GWA2_42_14]OGZ97820.1 MAG: phosphoglycerate mutase (2,3-diphosphoglycerate-independent) [Candidatus Sungbacteria bacterium RIFCSPHIGHO2_02_FULL_41_12b]OHA14577.1 MAG: phosphoglycerate mutase (2,3-diphosphoglycerate-independent) [Candidatus Sungbacteria bacterium RIFCSPLOWO2_12_FULL_41_11]
MQSYKPVILIILDGFGISEEIKGNPIAAAEKPTFGFFEKNFPFTTVQASSLAVGLPYGEAGNSEVGHLTIGAGRPIYHHLPRIIYSIRDGSFFQNPSFLSAVEHVRKNSSALHLLGMVSSGSVHAYVEHLYALMEFLKQQDFRDKPFDSAPAGSEARPWRQGRVFLHILTDGKDAPMKEGGEFVKRLQDKISAEFPFITIASVVGRTFAMDRDQRWEKIKKIYDMLTTGQGFQFRDPAKYINDSYVNGVSDEFIEPGMLVDDSGNPVGRVNHNDAMITFNFREDSMREISEALVKKDFSGFVRGTVLSNFLLVTMTEYEEGLEALPAFSPLKIKRCLSEVISNAGLNQLHIAESEKYAHVTYFFNGGKEEAYPHEERLLIPSPRTAHFDEVPEMNAAGVKEAIFGGFSSFDFILANFANADMVGHSGNFDAVKKSIEVLDKALGEIVITLLKSGGALIITGDHGNAERKLDIISGEKSTKHTINAVPFFLVGKDFKLERERTAQEITAKKKTIGGVLTDIAPTVLELLGLEKPVEMIGKSLLSDIVGKF